MQKRFDVEIKEFLVSAIRKNGEYINKWFIGANKLVDNQEMATALDNELRETNKNYNVARTKSLKGVEAEVVPVEHFYRWSEEHKKLGGQTKIPRVMKEEDFLAFQQYMGGLVSPK